MYWIGVAAFGLNLLLQLVVLLFQAYTKPVISDGKFRIIELSGDKAPCSFGNNIFINPEKYDWETYSQILLHEKIHIQQRHSLDILMAELVLVLQWFNPFAWLYRTELESNLEFLTDDAVLEHKEIERSSYQMSLLKVSAPHLSLGITTNYNQSLLKKRIVMMNAKRSNIHTMWKYFFLVPLLGILACALMIRLPIVTSNKIIIRRLLPKNWYNTKSTINEFNNGATKLKEAGLPPLKAIKYGLNLKVMTTIITGRTVPIFMISDFSALPKDQKGEFTLNGRPVRLYLPANLMVTRDMAIINLQPIKPSPITWANRASQVLRRAIPSRFACSIYVTKETVATLRNNGYKDLTKDNLISIAALEG